MLRAIRRITREEGLSAIIVEQHPQAILAISDTAAVLDRGTVVHTGTARSLQEQPALLARDFFLGRPSAARVARGDHRPDLDWRLADGGPISHGQWHDAGMRCLQMVRTAEDGSSVLLVINGTLDFVEFVVPDGALLGAPDAGEAVPPDGQVNAHPAWHLAWHSMAEHPSTVGTNDDAQDAAAGSRLLVDQLSLRVYTAPVPD